MYPGFFPPAGLSLFITIYNYRIYTRPASRYSTAIRIATPFST